MLYEYLNNAGITAECIMGSVSLNKRTKLFQDFQTLPDPRVLIIQPQAAAHGITLTAANTVIWYSPITSTETYLQANARINRKGQKNAMTVVNIEGSAVERKLYRLLSGRLEAHIKLLDLYGFGCVYAGMTRQAMRAVVGLDTSLSVGVAEDA